MASLPSIARPLPATPVETPAWAVEAVDSALENASVVPLVRLVFYPTETIANHYARPPPPDDPDAEPRDPADAAAERAAEADALRERTLRAVLDALRSSRARAFATLEDTCRTRGSQMTSAVEDLHALPADVQAAKDDLMHAAEASREVAVAATKAFEPLEQLQAAHEALQALREALNGVAALLRELRNAREAAAAGRKLASLEAASSLRERLKLLAAAAAAPRQGAPGLAGRSADALDAQRALATVCVPWIGRAVDALEEALHAEALRDVNDWLLEARTRAPEVGERALRNAESTSKRNRTMAQRLSEQLKQVGLQIGKARRQGLSTFPEPPALPLLPPAQEEILSSTKKVLATPPDPAPVLAAAALYARSGRLGELLDRIDDSRRRQLRAELDGSSRKSPRQAVATLAGHVLADLGLTSLAAPLALARHAEAAARSRGAGARDARGGGRDGLDGGARGGGGGGAAAAGSARGAPDDGAAAGADVPPSAVEGPDDAADAARARDGNDDLDDADGLANAARLRGARSLPWSAASVLDAAASSALVSSDRFEAASARRAPPRPKPSRSTVEAWNEGVAALGTVAIRTAGGAGDRAGGGAGGASNGGAAGAGVPGTPRTPGSTRETFNTFHGAFEGGAHGGASSPAFSDRASASSGATPSSPASSASGVAGGAASADPPSPTQLSARHEAVAQELELWGSALAPLRQVALANGFPVEGLDESAKAVAGMHSAHVTSWVRTVSLVALRRSQRMTAMAAGGEEFIEVIMSREKAEDEDLAQAGHAACWASLEEIDEDAMEDEEEEEEEEEGAAAAAADPDAPMPHHPAPPPKPPKPPKPAVPLMNPTPFARRLLRGRLGLPTWPAGKWLTPAPAPDGRPGVLPFTAAVAAAAEAVTRSLESAARVRPGGTRPEAAAEEAEALARDLLRDAVGGALWSACADASTLADLEGVESAFHRHMHVAARGRSVTKRVASEDPAHDPALLTYLTVAIDAAALEAWEPFLLATAARLGASGGPTGVVGWGEASKATMAEFEAEEKREAAASEEASAAGDERSKDGAGRGRRRRGGRGGEAGDEDDDEDGDDEDDESFSDDAAAGPDADPRSSDDPSRGPRAGPPPGTAVRPGHARVALHPGLVLPPGTKIKFRAREMPTESSSPRPDRSAPSEAGSEPIASDLSSIDASALVMLHQGAAADPLSRAGARAESGAAGILAASLKAALEGGINAWTAAQDPVPPGVCVRFPLFPTMHKRMTHVSDELVPTYVADRSLQRRLLWMAVDSAALSILDVLGRGGRRDAWNGWGLWRLRKEVRLLAIAAGAKGQSLVQASGGDDGLEDMHPNAPVATHLPWGAMAATLTFLRTFLAGSLEGLGPGSSVAEAIGHRRLARALAGYRETPGAEEPDEVDPFDPPPRVGQLPSRKAVEALSKNLMIQG